MTYREIAAKCRRQERVCWELLVLSTLLIVNHALLLRRSQETHRALLEALNVAGLLLACVCAWLASRGVCLVRRLRKQLETLGDL